MSRHRRRQLDHTEEIGMCPSDEALYDTEVRIADLHVRDQKS
jgi:hypothetical protein